jgi:general secretion pathway protein A
VELVDAVSEPQPWQTAKVDTASGVRPPTTEARTLPNSFILEEMPAMTLLLEQWAREVPADFTGTPCLLAEASNLRCRPGSGGWDALSFYRRPALLTLRRQDGPRGYALLVGLDATHAVLRSSEGEIRVPRSAVNSIWSDEFLILWQPAPGNNTLIGKSSNAESIRWLRQTLNQVPTLSLDELESGVMDDTLETAVVAFQLDHGLKPDGVTGPETLIQLNTAAGLPDIPLLQTTVH